MARIGSAQAGTSRSSSTSERHRMILLFTRGRDTPRQGFWKTYPRFLPSRKMAESVTNSETTVAGLMSCLFFFRSWLRLSIHRWTLPLFTLESCIDPKYFARFRTMEGTLFWDDLDLTAFTWSR